MSAIITSDSFDLSSVEMRGSTIMAVTRVMYIDGLEATDLAAAVQEALATAGVPDIFDLHPTADLRVVDIHPVAVGPSQIRLDIRYAYTELMLLDFNSVLEGRATDKDKDGNRVTVFCEGTVTRPIDERDKLQAALMNKLYPVSTFSLSQIRASASHQYGAHPMQTTGVVVGKVNSVDWLVEDEAAPPFAARTVLCTGVNIVYEGYSKFTYKQITHFMVRPETWDAVAEYIDTETGAPHVGIVPGTGSKTVRLYPEIDFNIYIGHVPK